MLCCIHFIFFPAAAAAATILLLLLCRFVVVGQNFVILQLIIIYCSEYTIRCIYSVKVTAAAASESAKTKHGSRWI